MLFFVLFYTERLLSFALFTFLFANLLQICITNRVAPARGQILQVLVVESCNDSVPCLRMKLEKSNGCICSVQSWHEPNPKQKSICKINNVPCFPSLMTKALSSTRKYLFERYIHTTCVCSSPYPCTSYVVKELHATYPFIW